MIHDWRTIFPILFHCQVEVASEWSLSPLWHAMDRHSLQYKNEPLCGQFLLQISTNKQIVASTNIPSMCPMLTIADSPLISPPNLTCCSIETPESSSSALRRISVLKDTLLSSSVLSLLVLQRKRPIWDNLLHRKTSLQLLSYVLARIWM